MKSKTYLLLLISVFSMVTVSEAFSQDVNFSQFFSIPLYFNPGTTGISTGLRARFLYRNQWPQLPVSYKSYYFSADVGDRQLPGAGGIGIYVNSNNDGVGFIHDLQAGLTLGVRVKIISNLISQVGIKAGYGQRTISPNDFIWPEQLDKIYGFRENVPDPVIFNETKRGYPDFGAGGVLQFKNEGGAISVTAGISVDHLFQPDISFFLDNPTYLSRKWVFHADVVYATEGGEGTMTSGGMKEGLKINPGILYQSQNGLSNLQFGLNALKFNFYLGGWIKTTLVAGPTSTFSLMAGYRYVFSEEMAIRFMYTYDMQMSKNLAGTGGAHEISLVLDFSKVGLMREGSRNSVFGNNISSGGKGPYECYPFY